MKKRHEACYVLWQIRSHRVLSTLEEVYMRKILIAVDDTKGSRNVLSVFHNFVQLPVEVILLHIERLEGRSMMIDMLGDPEMATLKEMLHGTEYKEALDKRSERILAFYEKDNLVGLDEPYKGALADVIRDEQGRVEFFRIAGRAHKKIS